MLAVNFPCPSPFGLCTEICWVFMYMKQNELKAFKVAFDEVSVSNSGINKTEGKVPIRLSFLLSIGLETLHISSEKI